MQTSVPTLKLFSKPGFLVSQRCSCYEKQDMLTLDHTSLLDRCPNISSADRVKSTVLAFAPSASSWRPGSRAQACCGTCLPCRHRAAGLMERRKDFGDLLTGYPAEPGRMQRLEIGSPGPMIHPVRHSGDAPRLRRSFASCSPDTLVKRRDGR